MGGSAQESSSSTSILSSLKLPEPPIMAAGALGGPIVVYGTTPMRNALSYAASDASYSILRSYKESFSAGFFRGWTGGQYYAVAACPQFVCLGPVYHVYASAAGSHGAVLLAGITESLIVHGAEKKNAQLSMNLKGGRIPVNRIQNPFSPFGIGLGLHISRNVNAVIGMRIFTDPIATYYNRVLGESAATTLLADLSANVIGACFSMPFHQVWNYTVSTPELLDKPMGARLGMMKDYMLRQYLTTTPSGATRISSVVARDLFLRSVYISALFTGYINIERAFIRYWPK